MRGLRFLVLALGIGAATCTSDGETPDPERQESRTAPAASAVVAPGGQLLHGYFEHQAEFQGQPISYGLHFEDGQLSRFSRGLPTASLAYRIVEEEAGQVTIEVEAEDGTSTQRMLRFSSDDQLFDEAAPEVVYLRATLPANAE